MATLIIFGLFIALIVYAKLRSSDSILDLLPPIVFDYKCQSNGPLIRLCVQHKECKPVVSLEMRLFIKECGITEESVVIFNDFRKENGYIIWGCQDEFFPLYRNDGTLISPDLTFYSIYLEEVKIIFKDGTCSTRSYEYRAKYFTC